MPADFELRPFNASKPLLVFNGTLELPKQRVNPAGIPGQVDELLAVFDACLHVGKLERAGLVLQRLQKMGVVLPALLIDLHNMYLEEMLAALESGSLTETEEDIHSWFELRIRKPGLPHTAETLAMMIKAALMAPEGKRRSRFIKRYMDLLEFDTALEDLYMTGVMSDEEMSQLAEMCPLFNMPTSMLYASPKHRGGDGVEGGSADQTGRDGRGNGSEQDSGPMPEVLAVPQKGMGLRTLKDTLSLFSEVPEGFNIADLTPSEQRELQSRLEKDTVDAAIARWREENANLNDMGLNSQLNTPMFGAKLYGWQTALRDRISRELALVEASEAAKKKGKDDIDRCLYGPFLRQSDPDRTAAVTLLATLSTVTTNGINKGAPLGSTVATVARALEDDILLQREHRKGKMEQNRRQRHRRRVEPTIATEDNKVIVKDAPSTNHRWPINIRTRVGAFLLSALFETAKVPVVREHPVTKEIISQIQPAFHHTSQLRRGKKIGMITPNKAVADLLTREPRGEVLARHLPMVCQPDPWTKFDKGGFLESASSILRIKLGEKDQEHYARAAIANGDMDQVMRGLDVLGKTAWSINRPVFNVMLEAWNSGEAIANFPPAHPTATIPPEPDGNEDPIARRLWLKEIKAAEQEKQGLHSVRCYINFQMEIARAFRDQTFYFPHNLDFRGRAYPMPTYLNHMGADNCRGLLRFAKGKPLGPNGLRWLKIHLSNVYGFDKASLDDRDDFATRHMDDIIDSVNNPLNGRRWWLGGEDPWQVLAACFEVKAACESPDHTKFISRLPVHQDGTCNGLQHYAALGGDTWGAKQVNLIPGDKPADIYTAVADLLEQTIARDLEHGSDEVRAVAKYLKGRIARKVVKQTVMTNVYGVTFVGAKKQVAKQLANLYPELTKLPNMDFGSLTSYVAANIFKALGTMFHGAHEIQRWFIHIGDRICRAVTPEQIEALQAPDNEKRAAKTTKAGAKDAVGGHFNCTLVWTTPLRMPVVQPYRKVVIKKIETCLQGLNVVIPGQFDPVHRIKQLQGFPPNFIHSLDASHMLLSALECDALGLTFAAVHDSFWTHPCDVEAMSDVIRDSFIRIHSDNITGRLLEEFKARYRGALYLESINARSPAGKLIREYRKKHRLSLMEELFNEYRRQQLLQSLDPEAVKEGLNMVTPATIFASVKSAAETIAPVEFDPKELEDADDVAALAGDDADVEASLEETDAAESMDAAGIVETLEAEDASEDAEQEQTANVMLRGAISNDKMAEFADGKHFGGDQDGFFKKKLKKVGPQKILYERIWLPITFPSVPEKGDFDVRQLKGSKYFFS
ncbi:hypothetical protein B0T14DRAFT_432876 [Immersiella caudata]|uniref:DNA-directed RNA polymerase n=1 Tax=Immersiella caudata TaxID=314043 RepID=A0AA40C063_9PEZI|nr:hypothetical protein B0T14DRAFT_432876 [Immersiella caudata]